MTITVHHGDCLDVLPTIASDSIDACVTDPPAGISFMGSKWDGDKGGRRQWVAWLTQVMEEVYRVLKPGAHAFVWALPKTSHWTGMALEDAGFEIREVHLHLFGSGFPKSTSISKRIDVEAGATREIVGNTASVSGRTIGRGMSEGYHGKIVSGHCVITNPATDAAKQWQGWGTATKPSAEFWWLVRKPISERTVAQNVLRHGTGGLNVDACRVPADWNNDPSSGFGHGYNVSGYQKDANCYGKFDEKPAGWTPTQGRWPSHVTHSGDPTILAEFAKFGESKGTASANRNGRDDGYVFSLNRKHDTIRGHSDSGTPARFFASLPTTEADLDAARMFYSAKSSTTDRMGTSHPTTKPIELIFWLCKLITPPNGVIIDPFGGSGTTAVAARKAGFSAVLIEKELKYVNMINMRLDHTEGKDTPLFAQTAVQGSLL